MRLLNNHLDLHPVSWNIIMWPVQSFSISSIATLWWITHFKTPHLNGKAASPGSTDNGGYEVNSCLCWACRRISHNLTQPKILMIKALQLSHHFNNGTEVAFAFLRAFPHKRIIRHLTIKPHFCYSCVISKGTFFRDLDLFRTKYKKQKPSYLRNAKSKGLYARGSGLSQLLGAVTIQDILS